MSIYTIYKVTNLINSKVYIGFTSDWIKRQEQHKKTADSNKGYYFHKAIRSHGWESFEWEVLYQSLDREYCLSVMEPFFIKEYNSMDEGYNLTTGGEGASGWYASLSTEEKIVIVKKMSDAHLTRSLEEKAATSKKMSDAKLNKSPEAKAVTSKKMSEAMLKRSPEEKAAILNKKTNTELHKSPEVKAATAKKKADSWSNRTPEAKAATSKKMSDAKLNRSTEEVAAVLLNIKEKVICCIVSKKEYNRIWARRLGLY